MNIRTSLIFLIFLLTISSCDVKPAKKVDFSLESFKEKDSIIKGEIYNNDKLFLGNPRWLKYHPDSFLVISELNNSSKFIKIIDLKNNGIQEMIPSGKGPGEMITAWGIGIINNKIWVFDGQIRKICILKKNDNRLFSIESEFSLKEKTTIGVCIMNDSLIACLSGLEDKKNRLTYCDFNGDVVKKAGSFPELKNNSEIEGDNNIFQSSISSFPNNDKVVLACTSTDIIEIYSYKNGLIKRMHGPMGIDIAAKKKSVGIGYKIALEPNCSFYNNIVCSDTSILISYCGNCYTTRERRSYSNVFPKMILSFSEIGVPQRILRFRNNILNFDVDWRNKTIYCLEWENENPSIVSYKL